MAALTLHGVTTVLRQQPAASFTQARTAPRRTHGGDVVSDDGHRGLWNGRGAIGPYSEATRQQWIAFVDGVGETWMFESASTTGSRGSVPEAGGTYTAFGSAGKFNGRVNVGSGSFIDLPSDINASDGWTIRFWRDDGGGWEHFCVFGTSTVAAANVSVDGGAVVTATSLTMENYLTVTTSTGVVRFEGKNEAGGSVAVDFSEIEIRPFLCVSAMATGLSGQTVESYALPTYRMGGDVFGTDTAGAARTIKAKAFADREDVAMIGGDLNGSVSISVMERR